MRKGFSLLETILTVSILSLMMMMLLPAIQAARATAAQADDRNKMRQMGLALHHYASAMDGRLPGTRVPSLIPPILRGNSSPHFNLLPFLEPEFPAPYGGPVPHYGYRRFTTRLFLSQSDPSIHHDPLVTTDTWDGATSFPANAIVFDGAPTLVASIPDGLTNTVWLAQRYFHTYLRDNLTTHVYLTLVGGSGGNDHTGNRSCTFADRNWDDVIPVRHANSAGETLPSLASVTFQDPPRVESSDGRRLQSFHRSGLLTGMLDGSVRTVAPGVAPSIFWASITPDGGELSD